MSKVTPVVSGRAQVCLAPKPFTLEELMGCFWVVLFQVNSEPRLSHLVSLPCPLALASSIELYLQLADPGRERIAGVGFVSQTCMWCSSLLLRKAGKWNPAAGLEGKGHDMVDS